MKQMLSPVELNESQAETCCWWGDLHASAVDQRILILVQMKPRNLLTEEREHEETRLLNHLD